MIKTTEEWIAYAKVRNRSIFFYDGKALDLTAFMFQHPGGSKILAHYAFKDITKTVFNVFPHKKEHTIHVLLRYAVGSVKISEGKPKCSNNSGKNLGSPINDKKKVLFDKKFEVREEGDVESQDIENMVENSGKSPTNVPPKKPMTSKIQKTVHQKNENKGKKSYEVSIQLICDNDTLPTNTITKAQTEKQQKSQNPRENFTKQFEFEQADLSEQLDEFKQDLSVPVLSIRTMSHV